jgi:adrenodoxin-NADP+ reductase
VFPALALVGWYNGHPAFRHNAPDLSRTTDVSIIGHGNVALDVARILLKPVEALSETDIPEDVLEVLAKSKVRSVRVVGRRGPAQVAFTAKEFREMSQIGLHRDGLDPKLATEARSIVGRDRARNRILDLMEKPWSASGNGKEFHLDFLKSPKSFNAASGSKNNDKTSRVGSLTWSVNELLTTAADPPSPPTSQTESVPHPSPTVIARPTDETVTTPADLVVESVGYRSEPLGSEEGWTLPFDRSRGRVRNVGGRIVDEEGMVVGTPPLTPYHTPSSQTRPPQLPRRLECNKIFPWLTMKLTIHRSPDCMPLAGWPEDQSALSHPQCTTHTASSPS